MLNEQQTMNNDRCGPGVDGTQAAGHAGTQGRLTQIRSSMERQQTLLVLLRKKILNSYQQLNTIPVDNGGFRVDRYQQMILHIDVLQSSLKQEHERLKALNLELEQLMKEPDQGRANT